MFSSATNFPRRSLLVIGVRAMTSGCGFRRKAPHTGLRTLDCSPSLSFGITSPLPSFIYKKRAYRMEIQRYHSHPHGVTACVNQPDGTHADGTGATGSKKKGAVRFGTLTNRSIGLRFTVAPHAMCGN